MKGAGIIVVLCGLLSLHGVAKSHPLTNDKYDVRMQGPLKKAIEGLEEKISESRNADAIQAKLDGGMGKMGMKISYPGQNLYLNDKLENGDTSERKGRRFDDIKKALVKTLIKGIYQKIKKD